MSSLLRALIVLPFCLPLCTQAHMQMSSPYPLRSALDPSVPEQYKDYSMTTPLNSDGSNFPCKRYQNTDTNPQAYDVKATYQAGSTYQLTLAGSATHEGGSCQISISYDNGASFKVIQSLIGGCPLDTTLNFTIPSFAPSSGSALLSWTWFNLVGNREMYQNCARVQIEGTPSQRYRRTLYRRQTSMDQLPDMFTCNVGNSCQTIENAEVVFPDPGPNVVYGQDGVTPNPGPGFVIAGSISTSTTTSLASTSTTTSLASATSLGATTISVPFPVSNSTLSIGPTVTEVSGSTSTALITSSISSFSTAPTATSSSTTAQQVEPVTLTVTVTVTASPGGTPTTIISTVISSVPITSTSTASSTSLLARDTTLSSSTTRTTITLAAPSSSPTSLPSSCTPGMFACNSPSTFSRCVSSGTYVYMGSVAAGMQCLNGQIIRQNAGSCTPNGSIFCNGSNALYICDQGGLVNMGPVAPGTVCRNGAIVAA